MSSRRRKSVLLAGAAGALLMVMGSPAQANAAAAVTYYSTAPGTSINVRSGPGTGYTIVRVLAVGSKVPIYCQTPGTTVSGYYGTSSIWDNIDNGEYISDTYVNTGSDGYIRPRCA